MAQFNSIECLIMEIPLPNQIHENRLYRDAGVKGHNHKLEQDSFARICTMIINWNQK